jgi:hypothetical protein
MFLRPRRLAAAIGVVLVLLLLLTLSYCGRGPQWLQHFTRHSEQSALTPHALDSSRILGIDDAVVSGFSGTAAASNNTLVATRRVLDRTFINTQGAAVRFFNPREPKFVWNGSYWAAPKTRDIHAGEVGQVFGIAIDDDPSPNIYLAATSIYGLNLVVEHPPGSKPGNLPVRVRKGRPDAEWMAGQFGAGGPSAIYRVDGRTGAVSSFATIALDGVSGEPAALGNIAYDRGHHQLFVSDLATGMIHRLDMDGHDLGHFDHGKDGRTAANLSSVTFDRSTSAGIANDRFDTESPATWGFAPAARRVWGLAVHAERLYYAVADGHIWSVGLDRDGAFANDARVEIDIPGGSGAAPVSDIVFSHEGAMIVAQRAVIGTRYDYKALKPTATAHVYRFWPETPDDPNTPSNWYQKPEEYAVGYASGSHGGGGGVDLGYGYKSDGTFDFEACEQALFVTGDALRSFHKMQDGFQPADGPLQLYGLQITPSRPVMGFNTPPAISYFVNYADTMGSDDRAGTVGGVRIFKLDCNEKVCPVDAAPTSTTTSLAGAPPSQSTGGNSPGGGGGTGGGGNGSGGNGGGDNGCTGPDCSQCSGANCGDCRGPDCHECTGPNCTGCPPGDSNCHKCVGADCASKVCLKIEAKPVCDPATGMLGFQLTPTDPLGLGLNTINAYSLAPGVVIANGPQISLIPSPGTMNVSGASPGQTIAVNVCAFNSSDPNYLGGKPYNCCRETLHLTVPRKACPIRQPVDQVPPSSSSQRKR